MESPIGRDNSLEDLVEDLDHAAKITAKQRSFKVARIVDRIAAKAYENGLSIALLDKLLDVITLPNHLDQATIGNLIRNLYPATKVTDKLVLKAVGSLGHGKGKPSYMAQAALLKWLIMVYDVLENQKVLSQVYSILFNLLDTIAIRPQLCHVLSLITRRKHVRPFRIQVLMELVRQAGNEPPLVGLMRVYKDYYPEVIVGDAVSGRASVFTHPNPEWRQRLAEIQETYFQRTQDGLPPAQRSFRVLRRSTNGTGQRKSLALPELRTSYVSESSVTLEEIEDVHDFIQKLEKIEPPNQLVSVIEDPLLQKFLQLRSVESSTKRIDNWLLAFFDDQLESLEPSEAKIFSMLEAILKYARYTKTLPQACLTYLDSMIPIWNGKTGRDVILELLAYIPISSFDELYKSTFQNLDEAIVEDGTDESKLALLDFYRDLLDQWGVSLVSQISSSPNSATAIASLINHASSLSLTILQTSVHLHTLSTILSFYESCTSLITDLDLNKKNPIRISIPPAELIYTLHFTTSLVILSRLCSILALHKKALENAITSVVVTEKPYQQRDINQFNGFNMDICNCLWRARALSTSDTNALGCLIAPEVTRALSQYLAKVDPSIALPTLFSLSHSPTLSLFAIEYVRELEDAVEDEIVLRHAGPVTQSSLRQLENDGGLRLSWVDYRLGVLHYLEKKGVMGVGQFMYNIVKNLRPK